MSMQVNRLGAFIEPGGVRFAFWSDRARVVSVHWVDEQNHRSGTARLCRYDHEPGIHQGFVAGLGAGALYDVHVDSVVAVDPYARALRSVHGPALVAADLPEPRGKRRIELARGEVFYELHVGTFTQGGTFASAAERLPDLVALGVTVLELMPIASFAGSRGWGYDGVALFAPFSAYGSLHDLRAFLDAAHQLGLSVVLDVVYNHLGPDGNYLPVFSDEYFGSGRTGPWGQAPALEKRAFRRLICDNARYWLCEVGFDGLRLDAAHELEPGGEPHILRELAEIAESCSPRAVLIAEDDRNDPESLFRHGVDALWSDDFHHCLHVLLTSERDGYYGGYQGNLLELSRIIERRQLYEGQPFPPTGRARGKPALNVSRERLIYALQNHDQVGNRAHGQRLSTLCGQERFHAASVLLLFLPSTPLLFMGEEWAEDAPFLYFTDHADPIGSAVSEGRRREFAHFGAFGDAPNEPLPDPQSESTFARSKLNWEKRAARSATLALHREALRLRSTDPVLSAPRSVRSGVEGDLLWVVSENAGGERLLLWNTGDSACPASFAARFGADRALLSSAPPKPGQSPLSVGATTCAIFSKQRGRLT